MGHRAQTQPANDSRFLPGLLWDDGPYMDEVKIPGCNVSVSPLGLPNLPGSPLSGRPAPPFALMTVSGTRITIQSRAGRVVVLTFVAVGGHNGRGTGAGHLRRGAVSFGHAGGRRGDAPSR